MYIIEIKDIIKYYIFLLYVRGNFKLVQEIKELISNVGFPIVACIFMYNQNLELQKSLSELSTTLKAIDTRIDSIENDLKGVE